MQAEFAALGYPLASATTRPGPTRALVEVYPHIALLVLCAATTRQQYKAGKASVYWRGASPQQRRANLLAVWDRTLAQLASRIAGITLPIPTAGSFASLKHYEDALDALICAWVGLEFLDGRAIPYGDSTAVIWGVQETITR